MNNSYSSVMATGDKFKMQITNGNVRFYYLQVISTKDNQDIDM